VQAGRPCGEARIAPRLVALIKGPLLALRQSSTRRQCNAYMSDLRNQIETLSVAEKVDLLDAVWESLEAGMAPLTDEQRSELDRRLEKYKRNPSDVIPWEQVKSRLFRKQ